MSAKTRANCPREHPRLFKKGTVKKGKYDNYVIVESATGVKRWKRQIQRNDIFLELPLHEWYGIPKITPNDYDKYAKNLTSSLKKSMDKLRNSYSIMEKLGIRVVECLNPISTYGFYWGDYPWDYAVSIHPDIYDTDKPCVVINIHIDENFDIDVEGDIIYVQHLNLSNSIDAMNKFISIYNSTPNGSVSWSNSDEDAVQFTL
jgi:hypothetical protein